MCSYDPSWAAIIRRQDELLRFDRPIENHDALTLGLHAVDVARELGHNLSIRVIANGCILFSHHMDGLGLENEWWMDKKLNACREVGISTLQLYCEVEGGERERPAFLDNTSSYASDGGCVPMRTKDGHIFGYVIASGAPHRFDHECATRAIARFLGVEVPTILK